MPVITYLLQVSACTAIFYAFYYLFLSRLTFFTINRWYLMVSLLLSFVIPLMTIPLKQQYAPVMRRVVYVDAVQQQQHREFISPKTVTPTVKPHAPVVAAPVAVNWPEVLKLIYLLATLILFARLIIMVGRFFWNVKGKESTRLGNVKVIKGDKSFNNGSFLNYIFLNDEALSPLEIQQIVEHELLHVRRCHSVDRLLAKVAQAVLWFNPFVYLYARSIEENHEFEVDREMGKSADKSQYADLLLHLSVAGHGNLYHSFSKVPLKKRITMLFTKPTNHMKKIIYLLVLPVVMISCLAFAKFKVTRLSTLIGANKNDGPRYKQIVKRTAAQIAEEAKNKAKYEAWMKTDDYARKKKMIEDISGKVVDVVVKAVVPNKDNASKIDGFTITYNNNDYFLPTKYGQTKQLNNILKVGDKVQLKEFEAAWSMDEPVMITPGFVYKNDKKIFQLAEADKIPSYPFLYEANKVRFAEGQVTNIQKYANGSWKYAQVQTVNGYKFDINFKPSNIDFSSIGDNDHVRLRFVHEVAGRESKTYKINDWVSITNNIRDYGVKNPDFFFKFYQLVDERTNVVVDTGKKTVSVDRKLEAMYAEAATPGWVGKPYRTFFSRLPIKLADGTPSDRAMFTMANGQAAVNLNPNEKLGVIIDDVFYTEEEVKKYAEGKNLMFAINWRKQSTVRKNNIDYYVPFTFSAMKLKLIGDDADTVRIGSNTVLKKFKAGNVVTPKENQMITDKALNGEGPFYERFTIHPNDNRRYDAVVLKLKNGKAATATLKRDEKLGVIIDGKLHDEDLLKKLPEKTIAALTFDALVASQVLTGYKVVYTFKTVGN